MLIIFYLKKSKQFAKIIKNDFNEIIGKFIKKQLIIQKEERIKLFKEADVN